MTNVDEDDKSFWGGYADGESDGKNGVSKDYSGQDDYEYRESYRCGYDEGWHDGNMRRASGVTPDNDNH